MKISLIIVVIDVFCGIFLGTSDEDEILEKLSSLENAVSMPEGEGNITLVLKQRSLEKLLNKQVSLNLTSSVFLGTEFSRTEISANVVKLKKTCKSLVFDFVDVKFINLDEEHAEITFTARLTMSKGESENSDIRTLRAELENSAEGWVFTSFNEESVLER